MPVDSQLQEMVDSLRTMGLPKIGSVPVADLRAFLATPLSVHSDTIMSEDFSIPCESNAIPVRMYKPAGKAAGLIVYFHGGGFVLGDLDSAHAMLLRLSEQTSCAILSIEYRLAPENPFPAAVEDAWRATRWVVDAREDLTGFCDIPVILMGDSAGANLATVVARLCRDEGKSKISLQVLIYPVTDGDFDEGEMLAFVPPLLDHEEISWFLDQYIEKSMRMDSRFNPGVADLSNLPPTIILTAGYDLLAAQALRYADQLRASGNAVTSIEYPTAIHGFFTMTPTFDLTAKAIREVADNISSALATSSTL